MDRCIKHRMKIGDNNHNFSTKEGPMKSFKWIIMFSLVVFLTAASTSRAQDSAAPPVKRDCDSIFAKDQHNDRLDCKTENVLSALDDFVEVTFEYDRMRIGIDRPSLFTEEQRGELRSARVRAQNGKNRTHVAEGFKGAVAKQKKPDEDCFIKEYSGDGDGVCEKNEVCEEVIDDGIGDDDPLDRTCWPMKGKKKEVCVQVCQQPLVDDVENYDPGTAEDREDELEELEVALNNAKASIAMLIEVEMEAWGQRSVLSGTCGDFSDNSLGWWAFGTLQALQIAKNLSNMALNSCESLCTQTSFGWNCRGGCLALAIVTSILDMVYDGADLGFKVAGEIDTAGQMENMAECIETNKNNVTSLKNEFQPAGKIVILQEDVTSLKSEFKSEGAIGTLQEDVNTLKEELALIKSLLLTPQGKREGFPLK